LQPDFHAPGQAVAPGSFGGVGWSTGTQGLDATRDHRRLQKLASLPERTGRVVEAQLGIWTVVQLAAGVTGGTPPGTGWLDVDG
jgi:hypothetical protein